jgi:hypothetical protein
MIKFFNRKNLFIGLMSISTLALAGSAAYYSVFGLSSLFAGARLEVIIMAGALEFSKLILASYLHNNWKTAGWMKWYLTLAVGVLMLITSAGIYGFLTSAYQKTADQLGVMDKQVQVIELKKERFQEQLDYFNVEKKELSESITELRNGLSNNVVQYKDKETGQIITTSSSSQRRTLTNQLEAAVQSRDEISKKIEVFTDSITSLDLQILDLESNNEVAAEVGPLRYMSEITGKPMNVIVNIFTLLIVFVFDPLAISMVIALNKLTKKEEEDENGTDIANLDFDIDSIVRNSSGDTIDDTFGGEIPIPTNELGDDRDEVTEEENEEIEEEVEEIKEEKKERSDVEFIPTDEEAKQLYGEIPIKPKKKKPSKPKHTYITAQRRKK